jgi:heavy metal translocating P-type ATPase
MHADGYLKNKNAWIAVLSALMILLYLLPLPWSQAMRNHLLMAVMVVGGLPMIFDILKDFAHGELGADALAVVSISASFWLKEYLAGSILVLMLSGGALLESYAMQSASSVLGALLKRMPKVAHRKTGAAVVDIPVEELRIRDRVVIFPHETAPVDGIVVEGHGAMDESYLTGEPFLMSKAPGSEVYSGAINGEVAMILQATKLPSDSRYAKIMAIMRAAETKRPRLRRLADQVGAIYTPLGLMIAALAWWWTGSSSRFLAVVVVATPCPLIIAIPVAIIGAISLSARRGIIVKNPLALEQIQLCRTAIYDKTGTLTYGEPRLVEQMMGLGFIQDEVLELAAALERYSKHPLAYAIQTAAQEKRLGPAEVSQVSEKPGQGLEGIVRGKRVRVTGRKQLIAERLLQEQNAPASSGGLECFVVIDGIYAARYVFRDAPRSESPAFVQHLGPRHSFERQMIVSGDRDSEVRYLADAVGITEVHAGKSPEEKLDIVRAETARAKTLYIGDGINDAPAMLAATVGIAIGKNSDVTAEAAGVVVMENSLRFVDEFMHISERMRAIALQSAVGGMILSLIGMAIAAAGYLPPVAGAVAQEIIDLVAIFNALRAAFPPRVLTDLSPGES